MGKILASREQKEWKEIQDADLKREFADRLSGREKRNTFDLEDVDQVGLEVLSPPLLEDVKKVILWADEKRRSMEDFRAWRRNMNSWIGLVVSIALGVALPFIFPALLTWALNGITILPQFALLAVRTIRKY